MLRTPDLAGRALDDRYELHAAIGEGAFGRVYEGRDRRLARAVAVKVIKPWWAEDSEWVERFEREAQLLARVNDPGIVQIFDIGHAEEGPYYVAELVSGESLAARLERGPLDPAEARTIAEQLCRALGSAHAQGVLHCDVKPANVMLTGDGQVKVGDFGVARLAGGTSQALTATVAGTPRYMSPEQARGRATTAATDVYSAGVVLYEMLAGKPPFEHGSPVDLGLRHIQEPPPALPAETPRELSAIVARALAKDPAERYSDGAEMAGALHAAELPRRDAQSAAPAAATPRAQQQPDAAATAVLGADATIDLAGAGAAASATRVLGAAAPPGRAPRSGPAGAAAPPSSPPPARHAGATHSPRRRRRIAVAAALLVLAAGALAIFIGTRSGAITTVPELRGLPAGGVSARAEREHVDPVFARHYSESPAGLAIAQSPAAGTRVERGSRVRVIFSAGPPPVSVPGVVGAQSAAAESTIANAGLRYSVNLVAAPGSTPGAVLAQSPRAAASAPRGSTIALDIVEAPRWRPLTSFAGVDDGHSVAFRIRGEEWRVRYNMAYEGTCLLIITCLGPSAQVRNLQSNATFGGFELNEGSSQTHVFKSGPGLYRVEVAAGHDAAQWSISVEDHY